MNANILIEILTLFLVLVYHSVTRRAHFSTARFLDHRRQPIVLTPTGPSRPHVPSSRRIRTPTHFSIVEHYAVALVVIPVVTIFERALRHLFAGEADQATEWYLAAVFLFFLAGAGYLFALKGVVESDILDAQRDHGAWDLDWLKIRGLQLGVCAGMLLVTVALLTLLTPSVMAEWHRTFTSYSKVIIQG